MPGLESLLSFIAAAALLGVAPGPDNMFVLTQSIVAGRAAGVRITLGLCTGLLVHTALVSLGVAAVLQASALAFAALKYAGAAYLLYLAVQAFRTTSVGGVRDGSESPSPWRLYRRGIVMNVTNPKVSLFFMAFLPQFADAARGPVALQLLVLGLLFIVVTLAVFGLIAVLAGAIGRWLSSAPRAGRLLNMAAGTVFAALAVRLALAER